MKKKQLKKVGAIGLLIVITMFAGILVVSPTTNTATLAMPPESQQQQNINGVDAVALLRSSELSTEYHYVGADTDSVPDYLSIFAPFDVTVKFFDQSGDLRATENIDGGSNVFYSLDDIGFSPLYYVRLVSCQLSSVG